MNQITQRIQRFHGLLQLWLHPRGGVKKRPQRVFEVQLELPFRHDR